MLLVLIIDNYCGMLHKIWMQFEFHWNLWRWENLINSSFCSCLILTNFSVKFQDKQEPGTTQDWSIRELVARLETHHIQDGRVFSPKSPPASVNGKIKFFFIFFLIKVFFFTKDKIFTRLWMVFHCISSHLFVLYLYISIYFFYFLRNNFLYYL